MKLPVQNLSKSRRESFLYRSKEGELRTQKKTNFTEDQGGSPGACTQTGTHMRAVGVELSACAKSRES